MKKIIIMAFASSLSLSACAGTFTPEHVSGSTYLIKYKESQSTPDYYDARLPPEFIPKMELTAEQTCPRGYEKIREIHKSLPNRQSYTAWEIRCLK